MKTAKKDITAVKENGRFYTPDFIVNNILDLSGYRGAGILKKHVIDNSCGDGAFLCQIVYRYCKEAIGQKYSIDDIRADLSAYIHGIEIEKSEQKKCISNITRTAAQFDIRDVDWDIICRDALSVKKYNGKMDFVLGNPPYVRVHNLGDSFDEIKKFSFTQNGMTDLFIVFYELGIRMLNKNGVLGYITPSSYFSSLAGAFMRNYLMQENLLQTIVDLRHFQAFSSTTYTAITILSKGRKSDSVDYYRFDDKTLTPYYIDTLKTSDYQLTGSYYFAPKNELDMLKKIYYNTGKSDISVKNGYATLCDDVFINDFDFDSEHIIPAIKASKGISKKIIFPYDKNFKLIPISQLRKDKPLYKYLLANKEKLIKRSNEKDSDKYWYSFGRSQAISDTFKDKLAVSSLVRTKDDLKLTEALPGTGVYGGLYIVSETIPMQKISSVLRSDEFITFISLLGKYKSGGYYTFSSKDVKTFLDYKFACDGGF